MKVKTITCHDVYNVGASLQAYALSKYLQSLGNEVEIIDYKPEYLSRHYGLWGLANPAYDKPVIRLMYNLAKFPGRLKARFGKRKKAFDYFTKNYLKLTEKRYHSNDELKNELPEADVYIAGSDQIWNTVFPNGKDPSFYLDFAPKSSVRASYAASFATDDVLEEYKEKVKGWLSDLDYISVREKSGVKIIENLGIGNAIQVLDPVFLLDRNEWEQMITANKSDEPYVLLYDFDGNNSLDEAVRNYALKKGWKVYSCLNNSFADRCFEAGGPLEFLRLVKNAKLVVSNSFHATAFSIIFEKEFFVTNRLEHINTRMRDLLIEMGIPERLVDEYHFDDGQLIDYTKVNSMKDNLIDISKAYLDEVLKG